jgi:DNA-binding PadR family transcriptional regulator
LSETSGKRSKNVRLPNYTTCQRNYKGELEMTEGALYPILHKLENEGIIFSEMQNVNGRDRKYYLLPKKAKNNKLHKKPK